MASNNIVSDPRSTAKLRFIMLKGEKLYCSDVTWLCRIGWRDMITVLKEYYPRVTSVVTNSRANMIKWLINTRPSYEEDLRAATTLMQIRRDANKPVREPRHSSSGYQHIASDTPLEIAWGIPTYPICWWNY